VSLRRLLAFCAALFLPNALPVPGAAQGGGPGRIAREQILELQAEKTARTPAQRKMASRLVHALRMFRGRRVARGVPSLRTGVNWDARGRTEVDLRARVTVDLLGRIEALGGEIVNAFPERDALRAHLPADALELLAALPEVRGVRPAERARLHKIDTTEGDFAHGGDALRVTYGVDGSGIAVGVLSDGVDSLAAIQASGDLPAVFVLPGQAGSGDEGTAMLEIVHDIAPGADLLFATALGGRAAFAANIEALQEAGADVIVDDVQYLAEAVFQDGVVAAAVESVSAAGVLYFSAAGNEGSLAKGTSGVWEGDFTWSGSRFRGNRTHAFTGGSARNAIVEDSPFVFSLFWSDPQGGSANDYDLYLLAPGGSTVIAASTDIQNGNDDPIEMIDSWDFDDSGRELLVVRDVGAGRYLHLNATGGRLAIATGGQTSGHSAARSAFSIGAVRAGWAGGLFDGSEPIERFSSDGPRRVFFESDGSPTTLVDFYSTGGEVRQKPDFAAANCVSTATPDFGFFCGTSAAAPHAAAIAALLLELGGDALTPEDVRTAFALGAFDIETPWVDALAGYGLIDAFASADVIAAPEPFGAAMLAVGAALLAALSRRALRRPPDRP
jgi:hypothetical protein